MTIIFLDIDGVLRTHKSDLEWSLKSGLPIPTKVYDRQFGQKCVSNINYIISLTGAKIVVSSTWRNNFTIEELGEIFRSRGIFGQIIDKTGIGLTRGEEILQWLDTNEIIKYVVIDDQVKDIVSWVKRERVVEVNCQLGFESDELVDKVLDILL